MAICAPTRLGHTWQWMQPGLARWSSVARMLLVTGAVAAAAVPELPHLRAQPEHVAAIAMMSATASGLTALVLSGAFVFTRRHGELRLAGAFALLAAGEVVLSMLSPAHDGHPETVLAWASLPVHVLVALGCALAGSAWMRESHGRHCVVAGLVLQCVPW